MSFHLFYMEIEMPLMSINLIFNTGSPILEDICEERVIQT